MPQVGPRVALAHPAAAIGVERPRILGVARLLDRDFSLRSKQQPMPRSPRGQDAIHHIHAELGVLGDLLGRAHSHQIARLVSRKVLQRSLDHFASALPRFANAKPADRIAGKANLDRPLSRFLSQFQIHPALNNAEKGLSAVISGQWSVVSVLSSSLSFLVVIPSLLLVIPSEARNPGLLRTENWEPRTVFTDH